MELLAGGKIDHRYRSTHDWEVRTMTVQTIKRSLVFAVTFAVVMALTLFVLGFNASQIIRTTIVATMIMLGLSKGLGFVRN
jgi:hypothetical protein